MDLISVIVPVYNALATLPRCAKSILTQSHSRLELILVDDGSADGSGGLLDGGAGLLKMQHAVGELVL